MSPPRGPNETPGPKSTSEACPAFKTGCPFPEQLLSTPELLKHAKQCPAFQSGCPFSSTSSVQDVATLLKAIPANHQACPGFNEAVQGASAHHSDGKHKEVVLCSNGKAFIDLIKTIRWDLFPLDGCEQPQLAADLKAGTKDAHTLAERAPFIKRFIRGNIDRTKYGRFLANMYFVYCALEEELKRHKDIPYIAPIYFKELERKQSLEADLQYFLGKDWRMNIQCSPAGRAYVTRLRQLGEQNPPVGLIAHCYTRYLGDLSGGQILQRVAKKALNLKDNIGTQFYEFPEVMDHKMFKDLYRQRLSQLPITPQVADDIVAEANVAFELNVAVFVELDDDELWQALELVRDPNFKAPVRSSKDMAPAASPLALSPSNIILALAILLFAYQCMCCATSKPHSFSP